MPTYEYLCGECEHRFEEFQSITAAPLENCPKCNGSVRRLIGGGNGLIFKGSGFYITDYKNSNGKSASKPNQNSESSSQKKNGSTSSEKRDVTDK